MASVEHGTSTKMWVGAPMRPQGGAQETSGRVQAHSLLRESITSGDLLTCPPLHLRTPPRASPLLPWAHPKAAFMRWDTAHSGGMRP